MNLATRVTEWWHSITTITYQPLTTNITAVNKCSPRTTHRKKIPNQNYYLSGTALHLPVKHLYENNIYQCIHSWITTRTLVAYVSQNDSDSRQQASWLRPNAITYYVKIAGIIVMPQAIRISLKGRLWLLQWNGWKDIM